MLKSKISPSLMCADFTDIKNVLKTFEEEGIEYLHIDVMDGEFVPNFMLSDSVTRQFRKYTNIPYDYHLMINSPEDKLDWFDIKENDLVAIGDGHNIIAIGEVISSPFPINQFGIACAASDIKCYLEAGNVCGCTVRYFWLDKKDQFSYGKAGRFFHASNIEEMVNMLFNKLNN